MNPPFSIVIPTRQRHETLPHALETVLAQSFPEFELIVMDNCSSPETEAAVQQFNDPRIRYYRTPERLSMADNWELALSHATGDYIFFLGDDDGLLPDGLELGWRFLQEYNVPIVSWEKASSYYWASCIVPHLRDRLFLRHVRNSGTLHHSFTRLRQFYQWQTGYGSMPMIYNGFVHRDVIQTVKAKYGRYFLSPIPDVASGIINTYFTDQYLHLMRPLSLAGTSGQSTGMAYNYAGANGQPVRDFLQDAKQNVFEQMHPDLIPATHSELLIANVQLQIRDLLFHDHPSLELNWVNLLNWVGRSLVNIPSRYDSNLQELMALAQKHRIPLAWINIAARPTAEPEPTQGFSFNAAGFVSGVVNCQQAGITTIAEAVKLAQALLPAPTSFDIQVDRPHPAPQIDALWYTMRSTLSLRSRLKKALKLS